MELEPTYLYLLGLFYQLVYYHYFGFREKKAELRLFEKNGIATREVLKNIQSHYFLGLKVLLQLVHSLLMLYGLQVLALMELLLVGCF